MATFPIAFEAWSIVSVWRNSLQHLKTLLRLSTFALFQYEEATPREFRAITLLSPIKRTHLISFQHGCSSVQHPVVTHL